MKSKKILQILNITGFAVMVIVNALANIVPFNGNTTGVVSDLYPNLFAPAGLTFSIWGVIYLLLGIFSVYQARDLFKKEEEEMPFLNKIIWLFVLSSAANIAWIFSWHYRQISLSLIIMLILLITLILIYLRLDIGKALVSKKEKFLVHIPFSIYLGWITVATIANITVFLVDIKWDGLGLSPVFWTIFVIIAGTLITLTMLYTRRDIFYSLVVIWALIGIIIKRLSESQPVMEIVIAAAACIIIILVAIAAQAIMKKRINPNI